MHIQGGARVYACRELALPHPARAAGSIAFLGSFVLQLYLGRSPTAPRNPAVAKGGSSCLPLIPKPKVDQDLAPSIHTSPAPRGVEGFWDQYFPQPEALKLTV